MQKIRKFYIETSRGLVHAQEAGDGAITLVILTITSFGGVLLDRVLPLLAGKGYRVLALDLMGYGRSDKRDGVWLVKDFADNVAEALVNHQVAPDGLVCGHFSGWMGLSLCGRDAPLAKTLVIDGTPIIGPEKRLQIRSSTPASPIAWHEDGSHAVEYWKKAYSFLKRLDPDAPLATLPGQKFREAYIALLETLSFEPGTMDAAGEFDIERVLPQVRIPTLVMCSDTDWNLPHHPAIMAGLAKPQELRWPGVHPLHQLARPERAVEYVAALDQFFQTVLH